MGAIILFAGAVDAVLGVLELEDAVLANPDGIASKALLDGCEDVVSAG
jgi:hypothetical protein